MTVRTRTAALAVSLALAAPLALATAGPALASHGGGGGGGGVNCTKVPTTYPGIVTKQSFAAGDAGTVVLKRDAANDGLIVGKVTVNPGWSRTGELKSGPKVSVQFENATTKIELEAAQSAQYYGSGVLVVEIKTCALA